MTEIRDENEGVYCETENVDQNSEEGPFWKSHLYRLQQKAPQPRRIVCSREIPNKPPHYGREFHGSISREEADDLVANYDGCYLVRESQRSPGQCTLTMRFASVSKNFRLYYDGMHYVGDKRFGTIHDLVADGLITMYMDTYAKDYIDHMVLEAARSSEKKKKEEQKIKEDDANREANSTTKDEIDSIQSRKYSGSGGATRRPSFKPSTCEKQHNFKMNNFKGPHWCDFCRNFMWGLMQQGMKCQDCGMNAHRQCAPVIPPQCQPDKKYIKRTFGVDLTTLVKLHNIKRPFVVDICIKEVEKRGLESEGIYRISGFADDIEALRNSFDKDGEAVNVGVEVYSDINIISGAIKLYFRLLPIPLITYETYSKFIEAAKMEDKFQRTEALSEALLKLPQAHYETLKYLMGHLYRVAKLKDKNMMTEENLSIVFGPTLMRPESESLEALAELKFQRLAVELLISHQDVLFEN